jgi:hypothetical protein
MITGKQLFFPGIIDAPENNVSTRDPDGNHIVHFPTVKELSLVQHFKIVIGSGIENGDLFVQTPETSIPDHCLHFSFYPDLVTSENKIVSGQVEKDQPGKKEGKELPYHQDLRDFIPVTANV